MWFPESFTPLSSIVFLHDRPSVRMKMMNTREKCRFSHQNAKTDNPNSLSSHSTQFYHQEDKQDSFTFSIHLSVRHPPHEFAHLIVLSCRCSHHVASLVSLAHKENFIHKPQSFAVPIPHATTSIHYNRFSSSVVRLFRPWFRSDYVPQLIYHHKTSSSLFDGLVSR